MKKNNISHFFPRFSVKLLVLTCAVSGVLACSDNNGGNVVGGDSKVAAQPQGTHAVPDYWPKINSAVKRDAAVEQRVAGLLAGLTVEQKVAQIIQPEIRDISVADMRKYGFGSYLNGGGAFPGNNKHATPEDWVQLAEDMYQASIDASLDGSTIPTMWGTDAVHGHNNVIGATLFPHNIGLGAAHDPELLERIANITAQEVMVTGIDWVFAPTVAVVRDDRWGRTYEGYSEDPEIVKAYAGAIVNGLQGRVGQDFLSQRRVISTVKHFIGDGGTQDGDDQGNNLSTERQLFALHAQGYVSGLTAGAQTVMASFNSWQGEKNHGNKYLLTDVLKRRMGFDGFVVGDWNGHGQVKGCSNDSCPQAFNAGLDVFMVPTSAWKPLYHNTVAQVRRGDISMARLDDAVSRILRVKVRAGLFDKPSPAKRPLSGKTSIIGSAAHRAVARQAVRESLVLLKNRNHILPLSQHQHILLAGDGADNIGKQAGGWTITWQGTGNNNADFPGASSVYDGFKQKMAGSDGSVELSVDGRYRNKPDVAVVVFGEDPYAEGNGDLDNLEYQRGDKKDLALLKALQAQGIPVVSVFISGRPLWLNAELNHSDAFVAAWLPGSEGNGIADVLLRRADGEIDYDFTGKLSYSWPASAEQTTVNRFDANYQPLLPYGFGLHYGDPERLPAQLPEQSGHKANGLAALALLQGSVKAPWQMQIDGDGHSEVMNSSVLANKVLHIRSVDKNIQEDARQLSWNGQGYAAVAIASAFPKDLRAYSEGKAALTFSVKVDSDVVAPVLLAMNCQQQCDAALDISALLQQQKPGQWQQLSVDLACFSNKGVDFGKVFSPFSLSSSGQLQLSIADIRLQPERAGDASLSCQQQAKNLIEVNK